MVGIVTEAPKVYRAKVIVAGESCVGKTALVEVVTSDAGNFPRNYSVTTGVELRSKEFKLPQVVDTVELLLMDSSGYPLYETFVKKCWSQNSLVCLVYDMTNKKSFEKLPSWLEKVQPLMAKGATGLLIANKADMASRRFVTESMGREFAQKNKMLYFECSAKENFKLQDAFRALAAEWHKKPKQ